MSLSCSLIALLLVGSTNAFAPSAFSSINHSVRSFKSSHVLLKATPATGTDGSAFAEEVNRWSLKDADTIFSVIDEDGSGSISQAELMSHMNKAGYANEAIAKIFKALDTNKDGFISKGEFRTGLVKFTQLQAAPGLGGFNAEFIKEIREDADFLFNSIDTDKSGNISFQELKEHLQRKTNAFSDQAIKNMFNMLDVNLDKEISIDELRDAFVRYSALRQALGEGPNYK
jgi:Ca2+-binding EF-hand superfamily protein